MSGYPRAMPDVGPAQVLAFVVGVFHTALYVLIRGHAGGRLPVVLIAAVLGAYAGQAIGARIDDPLRLGDFGLLSASVVAWIGIAVVALVSILVPSRTGAR